MRKLRGRAAESAHSRGRSICVARDARLGSLERLQRPFVFAVIVANAVWALDSVLLLFSGWVEPTILGKTFVVGQALIVGALAEMEFVGLRRSTQVQAYARS
jgi:hypothetical protein